MVIGDKPVTEAQSNQRHFEVVDCCLRQAFNIPAEFVTEVADPSAAKNPFWQIITEAIIDFVSIQNLLQFFKWIVLTGSEFKYLFRLSGPIAEPVGVFLSGISSEN